MAANTNDEGSDWEYEYDNSASEVFLVNLDLTTLNRTFKSTGTDRGKRLNDLPDKKAAKKAKLSKFDASTQANTNDSVGQIPAASEAPGDEITPEPQHSLQFLDLHTNNPIVSYKGQAFSCTWTNMLGTNMFFSQPKETPLYDPEISTADFDMIGISRIKLAGNPMKVTPNPASVAVVGSAAAPQTTPMHSEKPGKSLGSIRRSNAKVNADMRKQANFLEQLMNIKKNKGEQDNVHVVMNGKIAKMVAAGKLKFKTQRRGEEIDELNRRIVRGDAEALRKLELIYSGGDEDSEDEDSSTAEDLTEALNAQRHPMHPDEGEVDSNMTDALSVADESAPASLETEASQIAPHISNDNG